MRRCWLSPPPREEELCLSQKRLLSPSWRELTAHSSERPFSHGVCSPVLPPKVEEAAKMAARRDQSGARARRGCPWMPRL